MRTQEEIVARIKEREKADLFGFEWQEYLMALSYDNAKPYLKPEYDGKDWKTSTENEIRERAVEYMPFAWEKANDCRGISANRSIMHYTAWLWLLGIDYDGMEDDYEFYGKPQLEKICNYLGLDSKKWDDGVRVN